MGLCTFSLLVQILATSSGCRTPWRAIGNSSEPSFDRLIEVERQSNNRAEGRDPMASRLRPGVPKYPVATRSTASPDAQRSEPNPAKRGIADANAEPQYARQDSEVETDIKTDIESDIEAEELLADVPAAQRELIRREMLAQRAQADAPDEDESSINGDRQLAEMSPANAGEPKYQLAASQANRKTPVGAPPKAMEKPYHRNISDRNEVPATEQPQAIVAAAKPLPLDRTQDSSVVPASYTNGKALTDALPNTPSSPSSGEELDWRGHIYQAIAQLEQDAQAASPEEKINLQMIDRLLQLSMGDINASSEPIDGLQPHGQEFVQHSLKSLYEVTNPQGNPIEVKRYSLAMLSQRKALDHLAAVSNLEVRNVAFCTEVDGFGVVTKFPQYNFKSDQELLLYCELDNFVSTLMEGKGYETQLQGSYEIVDSNGRRVADQLLPLDSHLCRNQRRDYFIAYRIYMPPKIDTGRYQLKLIVEDLKGRKFGQSTLDFQIAN